MTSTAEPTALPAAGAGTSPGAGPHGSGRVNLRTLITIRWIAVAGQFAAVLTVEYVLGFRLPLLLALATIGASVVLNLFALGHRASQPFLGDRDAWPLTHPARPAAGRCGTPRSRRPVRRACRATR